MLVVRNGHSFDQNGFVTLINKSGGLSNFEDKIYFRDSYQACEKVSKEISANFKLVDVHHRLYPNEKFAAHDSLEDVKALKRVFLHPLCSRELYNEVISNSRQLSSIRREAFFDKSTKISEQKFPAF